jgi:hypothetical protein
MRICVVGKIQEEGFLSCYIGAQELKKFLEPVLILRLRRFSGLFWPIFDFFEGGHIRMLILPASKKSKIGQKNLKIDRSSVLAQVHTVCS